MSAAALATNNAQSTLLSSLNATDTTMVVAPGTGALFANPSGGDYFYVTLINLGGSLEILKISARNGDTFTISERGSDGTAPRTWLPGDSVLALINAGAFNAAMAWAKLSGEANGLAPLDATAKLPTSYLYVGGTDGLVQLVSGKIQVGFLPTNVANGIAGLDADAEVPIANLPAAIPNGLATLGSDGILTPSQRPPYTPPDLSIYYLKSGGPISGNATVSGTFGVTGAASFGLLNAGDVTVANVFAGVGVINGKLKPSAATAGKIEALTYSTAAPSGVPATTDGAWWIQYEP